MKILMSCWEDLIEEAFRIALQAGGHTIKFLNTWKREQEFLEEAKSGGYDVVIVTNVGLPLNFSLGLIAPLRQSCSAKVIVMSGYADDDTRKTASRDGAIAFYQLPISAMQILDAVEEAAGMLELSR